jgi:hypothetical protein
MKKHLYLIALLFTTVLIMIPQLKIPWMLIDDGESLRIAQLMDQHFSQGDPGWFLSFEKESGRFRPIYWVNNYLTYKLFGFNSLFYHFAHLLVYVLISYLLYRLVYLIFKDKLSAILTGLFFVLIGPARENLYRLGTAEPILCLILISIFYFLFSRNLLYLTFFTFIAYFAKETSVSLLPFSIVIYLLTWIKFVDLKPRSQWRKFLFWFVWINLLAFLAQRLVIYKIGIGGWYSENYQLNISQTFHGAWYYIKLLIEEYKIFLLFPLIAVVKNRSLGLFALLFWFATSLFIQSFWVFGMGRYLPPILIGLLPVMAYGFSQFLQNKKTRLITGIILVLYLLFGIKNILNMYQIIIPGEQGNQLMVRYLAENLPNNGRAYFNFTKGGMEYLYEIPLHLKYFYNREDISINYLDLSSVDDYRKGDYFLTWRTVLDAYSWNDILAKIPNLKMIAMVNGQWKVAKKE